jgi:hypothetical protein
MSTTNVKCREEIYLQELDYELELNQTSVSF